MHTRTHIQTRRLRVLCQSLEHPQGGASILRTCAQGERRKERKEMRMEIRGNSLRMLCACPCICGTWTPSGGRPAARHGAVPFPLLVTRRQGVGLGELREWRVHARRKLFTSLSRAEARGQRKKWVRAGRRMAVSGPAGPGSGSGLQLPTFAAARALVKPGSCLSVGPHRRHVALAPRFLDRKRSGLREQLDRELLRYSESLRGVPVAYDNLKIVGELGDIYDDQGHVHLNVEADFVVFCPERGQRLLGTVNKVAPSHLGCLVHGCFNASIPKPEHMPAEQWQGLHFHVGDELEFEVSRLDSDAAGVFCIRGALIVSSLPPVCPALPEGSENAGHEPEPGTGEEKPKKKSKKDLKQPRLDGGLKEAAAPSDEAGTVEIDPQAQEAVNGLCEEEQEPPAKKKRHREEPEQDPLWHASDSSGYQSDHQKKKKKRKKHSDEPEGPVAPEEPRPKRKKKKE
ncbi:DNA-directed RNA polymerase I subunit RPA43 [Monodelphis domestica]|uniref:DNA-directed RNA polymerase I subunit RPA43 n=1 Tax=Monodelphis domestica TaxID=13616 RepID=UPI0024E24373|nr:DNA-directed RNA polymerase I subunit RPA43 [Monodelphis domestica]